VSVLRCEVARELAGYWGLDCLHKGVTWIGSCFAGSLTAPGCSFVTLLGGGKLVGLGDAARVRVWKMGLQTGCRARPSELGLSAGLVPRIVPGLRRGRCWRPPPE
jgi:hypothetical protein